MNESMKLSGFSIAPIILEVIASYSPKTGKSYENTYMITAFSNDRKAKAFYENWGVKSGNIVGNNYKVIKTSKRDLKAVSIHLKEKAKMTGEKMAIMLDVEWDGQVSGCDDILKPEEL